MLESLCHSDKEWQALLIVLKKVTMIRKENTTLHRITNQVDKRMSLEDIDLGALLIGLEKACMCGLK